MKTICIFGGFSSGHKPEYVQAAKEVGKVLAQDGISLITGAGNAGMMEAVSTSALEHGGKVMGVLPKCFENDGVTLPNLTELHVVSTFGERKQLMMDLADGFLALPGGLGTLDEILEVFTLTQVGVSAKPLGILNVEGYFNPFIDLLKHLAQEGMMRDEHQELLFIESDLTSLIERLKSEKPNFKKWW